MSPERKKIPFNLETFVKRSWPLLLCGVIAVAGLGAGLFYLAVSGKARAVSPTVPVIEAPTSTSPLALVPRHLDGVAVAPELAALPAYAVMVENLVIARPLAGVAEANLAIEAPVEGGITRFILFYDASTTAETIGPVRSARPYYVEWAEGLDAAYAHVGGSPESLIKISTLKKFRNLDQFHNGGYFWRSGKRAAPHNVFTRLDLLRSANESKRWTAGDYKPWRYSVVDDPEEEGAATATQIALSYGGSYNASWKYDTASNSYLRYQNGARQKDTDGTAVSSTNVIVLLTEYAVLDEVGRLRIRTAGKGRAWLFRDGRRFDLVWKRKGGEWLEFETLDGGEAVFRPGKTWISVINSSSTLSSAEFRVPSAK